MKTKAITLCIIILNIGALYACPVCERNQSKVLQGISHGASPEYQWDYAIVALVTTIVVLTLILSISYLLKPGEKNLHHIKKTILNQE